MKKIFTLLCCMVFAAQYSMVSAQNTTMKIWKGGSVTTTYDVTDVDSVTFESSADSVKHEDGVGHKFVDLGLPSGLLWAETNIGAETAADVGNYYAWGETEPQTSNSYFYGSYKYGTTTDNYTKYNSSDGKTTLDPEDDAAYVNWGDSCRMPTAYEFVELCDSANCTWTWTSMLASDGSSINGYKVTSVKNGNSIFLPASGSRYEWGLHGHGSVAGYWSSTLYSIGIGNAYYIAFGSSNHRHEICSRDVGFTVRPVAEP
jgi:hypothetical protein